MKRVLITGVNGFSASHLVDLLSSKKYEIYGTIRTKNKIKRVGKLTRINFVKVDIRRIKDMAKSINQIEPDYIFHLAGKFLLPTPQKIQEMFITNVIGTFNLLEAVRLSKIDPRIQIASSCEEYGWVYPNELPVKETNTLRPSNAYGVSKVAVDMLGYKYYRAHGIKTLITRAFNHVGPRSSKRLTTSNMAKQIVEIEKGKTPARIYVGDLEIARDFTDVRDIMNAYLLVIGRGKPGERYNVCSGKAYKMKKILDILLRISGVNADIKGSPIMIRPSDAKILIGDPTKIKKEVKWKPKYTIHQSLKDLLDYWRFSI